MSDASRVQFEKLKIFQKPQCLIETDRDGHLAIVKETKDELMKINMPLNVVAITGLYRTGKSYLMNRLAQHTSTSGFALGNSIQSETKGIWAWCKIHPRQKNQVLLLLDTEGLGDVLLAELLTAFVNAIKDGKVPCIDDALTVMAKAENERRAKAAIEKFKREIGNIKLPVPNKGMLLSICIQYQTSILTSLNAELVFDDGNRVEISAKVEMEQIYQKFEDENSKQLYQKCLTLLTRMYELEVEGNVKGKKYMVAGGYEKYKKDMERVIEKYNNQLANENVDPMEIQKAKNEFKIQKTPENEDIMAGDKNISQKEAEEKLKSREREMKQEFEKTKKEETERYNAELQRQNRRHEDEMEIIRRTQEEKDRANTAAFYEERLAQRDKKFHELSVEVGRLKGIEEERNRKKCPIM